MISNYIHRDLEKKLISAERQFPVIALTGPRQSGKSTLLKHCFPKHNHITLDNPITRKSCTEDPSLFLENYPAPLIIDEIQYAPELLPYIKIAIDNDRSINGQYIITGSQIFPLMKGLTESLAGRAAIFELQGMSISEFKLSDISIQGIFERIFTGSYPDPLVHKVDREIYYSSYIQTYLERDIRQIENIKDLSLFQNLLEILASRIGSILNISTISNEIGTSQTTVKRWIGLLENTRIIYLLRPYFRNVGKRIIKSPKIYFMDTGLAAFLMKYPDSQTLSKGNHNGNILENFVISEVLKNKMHVQKQFEPYFYRDSNHNEIDLVLDFGLSLKLIEIKMNKTIQKKHYQTLLTQSPFFSGAHCFILSLFEDEVQITKHIKNVHINNMLSLL